MFKNLTLGERLCLLRQGKEMTQKDLASQLNVSDKTISKWETSENEPSLSDIQKLSEMFNVSFDLILKGVAVGENDNATLNKIEEMRLYNEAKQEINNFYKKECPYKDIDVDDLFIIINNKPYAIFDSTICLDDFDYFNKVNEQFTFVTAPKECKKGPRIVPVGRFTEEEDEIGLVYLPHPYKLTLDDLRNNNSIEFLEYVVKGLEEKYNTEVERKKQAQARGYGRIPQSVEEHLSYYLEHIQIENVEDDRVYEKIIYLIDHGAVFYNRIPYDSDSGGYQIFVDTARTDFTYKVCVDHIRFINQIAELEEKIDKLTNANN